MLRNIVGLNFVLWNEKISNINLYHVRKVAYQLLFADNNSIWSE